jgi:acyl-coenzyme A synthetase/AMP-(fatty) acid ligase
MEIAYFTVAYLATPHATIADAMSQFNLASHCLSPGLRSRPRDVAFCFVWNDGRVESWTFGEVGTAIEQRARALLTAGLRRGDRVLICLDHSPEYAFAFFGATLAGLVPVPVSPALTGEEVEFVGADSRARGAVVSANRAPARVDFVLGIDQLTHMAGAAVPAPTGAEDPAFLIYTSGTTARPKGVLHAHRTVLGRALMRDAWQGFRPGDVVMHAGALNWSYTLGVGLMDAWAAGATAVLAERPDEPGVWLDRVRALGVNVFVAVPTVFRQALKYGDAERPLATLRHVLCAGEPLPPTLLEHWRASTGTEMFESLGMTEVSTYISSGPATPVRPGSPGRPQPGRTVAILPVDGDSTTPLPPGAVGRLAVHRSDPGLMLGYWNRPAEEQEVFRGEWFIGGDLAAIDDDGYVWFHGRADDIIKSFGYRLSPVEIEAVLEAHPGVAEAAVVGHRVDDDKTLVAAYLVPAEKQQLDIADVASHVTRHLAGYKHPHEYRIVAALPRTANGKLQRSRLHDPAVQHEGPGDAGPS